jgi:excinuclease ABC subunit C
LVTKNIEARFFAQKQMVEELAAALHLRGFSRVIECFDISHTSGSYMVGSMVQFRDGSPDKSQYRRFKIRDVAGIDDFLAMREVVTRRYAKLKGDNLPLPDLIVIDGGKGQLSSAYDAILRLGLRIPMIALAKREESVFVPGRAEPVPLPKKSKGLALLIQIRDEAHRFAITYHKLLRGKGMIADGE